MEDQKDYAPLEDYTWQELLQEVRRRGIGDDKVQAFLDELSEIGSNSNAEA